jgi:hypothetical protein
MRTMTRIRSVVVVTAMALLAAWPRPVRGQMPEAPIRLRAFAVNMTNVAAGTSGTLQITIDRWSTSAERAELIDAMTSKGQDALLARLQKAPVKGRINLPGYMGPDPNNYRLGWDLRYAWREPLPDGGDRLVIATDRYMSMWEVRNQPRTVDYPFTIIEIHMPKEGKGEGRMAVATQVNFDKKKNVIELEQYSAGTVRLNEITVEKK